MPLNIDNKTEIVMNCIFDRPPIAAFAHPLYLKIKSESLMHYALSSPDTTASEHIRLNL